MFPHAEFDRIVMLTPALALVLGGCAVGGDKSTQMRTCYESVPANHNITVSLVESLKDHGMNPVNMDGVVDTAGEALKELTSKRHNKTGTIYAGDSFTYCVIGSRVSLGPEETLRLEVAPTPAAHR